MSKNLESLLNHQSVLTTPIVRNRKVECSINMQFKKFSYGLPLVATDVITVHPLARDVLLNELRGGSFHEGPFVAHNSKDAFSVETDIDEETFDTKILKHRKTIRYRISVDLLSNLFYGVEEPQNSIFAYIFQLDEPNKLTLFSTESMKGKKTRNVIKFDIFKKVKISSVYSNFMIGIIVLTNSGGADKNAKMHILNGMTVFSRMIDNEKKRREMCESPFSPSGELPLIVGQPSKKNKTTNESGSQDEEGDGNDSKKFEIFMRKLGKDIKSIKTMNDLQNFCNLDDRSKILLQLLNQFIGKDELRQQQTDSSEHIDDGDRTPLFNTNFDFDYLKDYNYFGEK
ncbi:predicted protein [Naegleria gruberi]|uniref:Predicted protein n=1 Tax=Naegleria gruberi TaxID=5762 RepID=D2V078_NAEGR|nr:uncharacterized protein NAEGRDRAFT_45639 [Naegleria gruberi]EFC49670.1 predicted protein [Naegleria gruberi]|eukprot:XP_002682414.1 predicted protein [Naegleria gruberi strain NEG-M]